MSPAYVRGMDPSIDRLLDRVSLVRTDLRVDPKYVYVLPVGWSGHPAEAAIEHMTPALVGSLR